MKDQNEQKEQSEKQINFNHFSQRFTNKSPIYRRSLNVNNTKSNQTQNLHTKKMNHESGMVSKNENKLNYDNGKTSLDKNVSLKKSQTQSELSAQKNTNEIQSNQEQKNDENKKNNNNNNNGRDNNKKRVVLEISNVENLSIPSENTSYDPSPQKSVHKTNDGKQKMDDTDSNHNIQTNDNENNGEINDDNNNHESDEMVIQEICDDSVMVGETMEMEKDKKRK